MAPSPRRPFDGQGVRRISGLIDRKEKELRLATVNVGSMRGRSREVVEMLARRRVDICCVQEVKYKGEGCRMFGDGEERYKFWWSGGKGEDGVGILIREDLVEDVLQVDRINPRIIKMKIVMGRKVANIFSVYAPQVGRPQDEKEAFWGMLDDVINVPESEILLVAGDLNGHIGDDIRGFEEVMGVHGYGVRNHEGESILEFCQSKELRVINTMFTKKREHKITYKSGGAETQIRLGVRNM